MLLGVQFLMFCVWDTVLAHRFALTHDFITYEQAFYLISHGDLNPFSTTLGYPFWQDHGTFLLWPLAFLDRLWPHPVTLLWLQAAATVAAEAVALQWICEIASLRDTQTGSRAATRACMGLALILLVINPWVAWTVSSDFHTEPLAILCLIAAARDLFACRRRAWVWLALALLTGDVGASCAGALGLSAIMTGRRWWRTGLAVTCLGFTWMILLGAIHATKGTVPSYFAPLLLGHPGPVPDTTTSLTILKAIITHPGRALSAVWANRLNVWANLSAAGLVGIAWRPLLLPMTLVLLEGALTHGPQSSLPGFQNLPVLILGTVGSVAICLKLADGRFGSRRRLLAVRVLLAVLVVNGIGWAAVWLPQMSKTWLPVSPAAAGTLRQLADRIGARDQVVVQQGVSTGFARRRFVHLIFTPTTSVRVRAQHVWLIFAPTQGNEPATPAAIQAIMTKLAATPHVRLAVATNGIWAFEWTPPPAVRKLTLAVPSRPVVAAWTVPGESGTPVLTGPARNWHVSSNGEQGYVIAGDYWHEPLGTVSATVSLAVSGRANVELWDNTAGTLLARTTLSDTDGHRTVKLTGTVRPTAVSGAYAGWGPWRIRPKEPPVGHVLELRVWSPGAKNEITVQSMSLADAPQR